MREQAQHTDELAQLRARLEDAREAWLWHDATDDTLAGYGYHMMQMLYRLPKDGQTRDMQASIEQMLTDLDAALYAVSRAEELLDDLTEEVEELRAEVPPVGIERVAHLYRTAGLSDARDRLRAALTTTPTPADEVGRREESGR